MLNKGMILELMGEELYNIFKEYNVLLAGGSLRALYCSTLENADEFEEYDQVKDLDIYFQDKECICELKEKLLNMGYHNTYKSQNAITFEKDNELQIQLITLDNTIGGIDNILESFDFSVCSAVFDFKTEEFAFHKYFEEDNQKRKLRFNYKTLYPISSLIRVGKYTQKKKYYIPNIEYLKIALAINKIEINTYADLKEQLYGIDTYVLKPLTDALIGDNEEKSCDLNDFLDEMNKYLEICLLNDKEIDDSFENPMSIEEDF